MKRTLAALVAATSLLISAPSAASATAVGRTGARAASAQPPNAGFEPNWSLAGFSDQNVRQVVRVTTGGPLARVRLSTVHSGPVSLKGATIARTAEGGAVRPGSLRRLTFGHRSGVEVPAGREIASDAAVLPVGPLDEPAVTFYFAGPTGFHSGATATSFRASGDHLSDLSATAFTETTHSWYSLTGVDVLDTSPRREAVGAFGDSITDGAGSTVDADNRSDIEFECFTPNPEVTAADLVEAHRSLIRQAHARGVRAIGATLTPVKGFDAYPERTEAVRTELNTWIRTSGEHDAVVDFDRAVADPADPLALLPAYDSGDHIHPNDAGYHAMAAVVDLRTW